MHELQCVEIAGCFRGVVSLLFVLKSGYSMGVMNDYGGTGAGGS